MRGFSGSSALFLVLLQAADATQLLAWARGEACDSFGNTTTLLTNYTWSNRKIEHAIWMPSMEKIQTNTNEIRRKYVGNM